MTENVRGYPWQFQLGSLRVEEASNRLLVHVEYSILGTNSVKLTDVVL